MAEAEFFFHKSGEVRSFTVTPKFYSATEVALITNGNEFPGGLMEENPLEWKIKAQAFRGSRQIQEQYLKLKAGWFHQDGFNYYRALSLASFSEIDFEVFPRPVEIRLTVEKVDARYQAALSARRADAWRRTEAGQEDSPAPAAIRLVRE